MHSIFENKAYILAAEVLASGVCGLDHFHRRAQQAYKLDVTELQPFVLEQSHLDYVLNQLSMQQGERVAANRCADTLIMIHKKAVDFDLAAFDFDQSHHVESLSAALELADSSLAQGGSVAIVGINTSASNSLVEQTHQFHLEQDFKAYCESNGIAALVLSPNVSPEQFYLAEVSRACNGVSDVSQLHDWLLDDVQSFNEVGFVESQADQTSAELLNNSFQNRDHLSIAYGSCKTLLGDGGAFTDVAAIIHAALTVQQRFIPGIANWQQPNASSFYSSPFYFPVESSSWYLEPNCVQRKACVHLAQNAANTVLLIADNPKDSLRDNGYLSLVDSVLLPVGANSEAQLLEALSNLATRLQAVQSELTPHCLYELRREYFELFNAGNFTYVVALLADSSDELLSEVEKAQKGVVAAFASHGEWKTPKGSYFSANPVNAQDDANTENVCFLYPGIGATYVGLGKDLFQLFPEIYAQIDGMAESLVDSMKDRIINPRGVDKLGFKELKTIDSNLRNHLADIAECGVAYAVIFTRIFQQALGLKADFAAGYSMGEVSMFAGLGCWQKPGLMSERLANSETFNERLSGDLKALKAHWGLAENAVVSEKLWETYTLKATPEDVAKAAEDEDRVYTTIINTPDSLVIGGDPDACQRVIKRLGVRGMALDMPNAIHSPPAFKEYEQMEALYTLDVNARVDTKLYSSSCYLPVPQRSKAIANSIAKCLCDPVDFPRLVDTMFDKGARVFIEVGPGRSLTSWTEKIIAHDDNRKAQAHVSLPINAKGTADELTLLRAVAKLISHGAKIDVKRFYQGSIFSNLNH